MVERRPSSGRSSGPARGSGPGRSSASRGTTSRAGASRSPAAGRTSRPARTTRSTGPAKTPTAGRGTPPQRRPGRGAAAGVPDDRPRLTGRAAVLVGVLVVLAVSYASSMRAYVAQRDQTAELKAQIAQRSASIDDLEREKRRWADPKYVQDRAREDLGYVRPGDTSFVVLGKDGEPLEPDARLAEPAPVTPRTPTAWWDTAWQSVEDAGEPRKAAAEEQQQTPKTRLQAPADQTGEETE